MNSTQHGDSEASFGNAATGPKGRTRADLAQSVFSEPARYLARDFHVRIRADIVQALVGNQAFQSILDVGCGDGTLSLPLLRQANELTLLDVSRNMLTLARSHIPSTSLEKVKLEHADFMEAALEPEGYDLILCLGVLAHVDSPARALEKIVALLRPGGSIIVQNSDARHPVGWLFNEYEALRNLMLHMPYAPNWVGHKELTKMLDSRGMRLSAVYRYNLPIPGMARLLTSAALVRLNRLLYGTPANNRLAWLGGECIYHFIKANAA
jgi:ubiquinone/menaquinone biosynthesis C-methylase UbiE